MTTPFGARLAATIAESGRLCVGIDPHPHLLDRWGLTDDADGARAFGLTVVHAADGRAGIVKPQVAFFERFGSAGYAALEEVLSAARDAGLLVIADAKRGDVGTSVEAYAQAWLAPGSPLESDAMTVSAYPGVGSLDAAAGFATEHGKGLFVLAVTSNREATKLQTAALTSAPRGGMTVAAGIVADVRRMNGSMTADAGDRAPISDIGTVIGATVRMADYGIRPDDLAAFPALPVLAPGFGHQGARLEQVGELFGAASRTVIASVSRSILEAGRAGIRDSIAVHADALLERAEGALS